MRKVVQPALAFPHSVIQRVRRRVQKPGFSEWWWNDQLVATWQGHNIPVHACHTTHVGQNQLVGGWTFIDDQGHSQQSGVCGPYSPGQGKDNHVERQLIEAMENDMEAIMGLDDGTFSDNCLILIEVHQWVTPCSGGHGCTTYLDNQVNGFDGLYAEISAGARLKAEFKYNGGISETHPVRSAANVTTFNDNNAHVYGNNPSLLHNFPAQWW